MKLDVAVIIVLIIFIFWGMKRGLAKVVMQAASSVISLTAGFLLYRPIRSVLEKADIAAGLAKKIEDLDVAGHLPGVMLDLPAAAMRESELSETLNSLLAEAAISILSFLTVVILVRLVLIFISATLGLASGLPVVRQANGLAGGIIGFFLGLIFVLVTLAALGVFVAFGRADFVGELMNGSRLAAFIYNNNPILELLL